MKITKELEMVLSEIIIDDREGPVRTSFGLVRRLEGNIDLIEIEINNFNLDGSEQSEITEVLRRVLRAATRKGRGVVISGPGVTRWRHSFKLAWVMVPTHELFSLGKTAQEFATRWLASVEEHAAADSGDKKPSPEQRRRHQQGALL